MSKFMGFDFHKDVNDEVEETSKIVEEAEMFDSKPDHKNLGEKTLEETARDIKKEYSMSMDNLLDAFFELAKDEESSIGKAVHQAPSGMLAIPAMIMEVWKKAVEKKGEE